MRYTPLLNRETFELDASPHAVLAFITVTHPQMAETIRLVLDGVDYLVEGNLYKGTWLELGLLSDSDKPPQFTFRFPNVDRRSMNLLRSVISPPRLTLELTTSAYFDRSLDPRELRTDITTEWSNNPPNGVLSYRARGLFITDTTSSSQEVEGTCRSWDYRQEEWPSLRAKESLLPGSYAT